jgi:hypothetical protein
MKFSDKQSAFNMFIGTLSETMLVVAHYFPFNLNEMRRNGRFARRLNSLHPNVRDDLFLIMLPALRDENARKRSWCSPM